MTSIFQKLKKREKRTKGSRVKLSLSVTDYFHDIILGGFNELNIKHPNDELWLNHQIRVLCKKSSSTQLIPFLGKLCTATDDAFTRSLLARKIHELQTGYLQSFKEYSDRALILLAEREKEFDQWEGIYILGCFGKDSALKYLETRAVTEQNKLLRQTIARASEKIKINKKKRKQKRGFS
ncbi:MAG: hypothetical protein E2O76_08790 [Caldithrix sp.]|nr:MAG: hypothetical protein E2O79_00885 [Caldithrix sp.]TDI88170.1 MAG: hypothetical protein E2O77_12010 [Caldithrix sp.]TDI98126.1 MAG: hypothetical protein E2O76_08790 [Caldithrix sp.]